MTTFYFGVNSRDGLENVLSWGVKDILVSYAYLKQVKGDPAEWKEMGARKVFIDSGAFSFGTEGRAKEADYMAFLEQHLDDIDDYAFMDYIEGENVKDIRRAKPRDQDSPYRNKTTKRTSLKAMKSVRTRRRDRNAEEQNMEALARFHARGLDPIAVWHCGQESLQLAAHYAKVCSKVGMGATSATIMDVQAFLTATQGTPSHGFGFTRLSRFDLVKRFDSVDSVSWSDAAKYSGYSTHGRMKGTGEFGGGLWQLNAFTRNINPETGSKVRLVDIKDYEGQEPDRLSGKRTERAILRQRIVVGSYLRRLRRLGILDYDPPIQ